MIRQTILKNCLKVTSVDDAKQVIVNGCDRATTDEAICFSPNGPMTISNENYFKRECDRTVYYCINSGASQMLSSYSSLDAEIQVNQPTDVFLLKFLLINFVSFVSENGFRATT